MKLLRFIILIFSVILTNNGDVFSQKMPIKKIYLIPGQGADYRLFNNLKIEGEAEIIHIKYFTPAPNTSLKEYALQLVDQIDTSERFVLLGVSLGGMIACEIAHITNPEKTIIISSAKSRNELPKRYTFQRKFPLYKTVSPRMAKFGSKVLQPIVEPDRKKEKETFKNMLNDKDPVFLLRTIEMIIHWDREKIETNIIHIHGDNDHTIPLRNVKADYVIKDGSHMITLTNAAEVGLIVNKILKNNH